MIVHVVMTNDFPDSVYADKTEAEKLCADKMQEQKKDLRPYEAPRVYWRVYEFDLKVTETKERRVDFAPNDADPHLGAFYNPALTLK